ncbi:MAG: hypothetical protein JRI34_13120 [Deltaproteobacteria bacterium]|nr:hypothetical protein [Deltaproteobacteria bacterium]
MEQTEKTSETPQVSWKCSNCGYMLQDNVPPEKCPSCDQKCEFIDVSCYTPECGQTGFDPRL